MGCLSHHFCGILLFLRSGFALDIDREFYTEESAYLKLQSTSQTKQFAAWDQECRALGDGWAPAVIYTATELKFIHFSIAWKRRSRSFYLGGSTFADGPRDNIFYHEYLTNSQGNSKIIISTRICLDYWPSYHFILQAKNSNSWQPSVLCKTDGLSFHSNTSLYQKLVSSTAQNISYWRQKCLEIGSGWIPAILNDEAEHDFMVESQIVLSSNKNYWIGGSAKTTGDIDFLHYFPYRIHSDDYPVFVSTQQNETFDNEYFQLRVGSDTLLLQGVLCENELGAGWAAAVLNDSEEFDFINQHERRVADRSYYWIGGLAYDTLESPGYSSVRYAWAMIRHGDAVLSTPEVRMKSAEYPGILCKRSF